jgi:NAD(P)-dependent dehydrogenase (short-subunit alcohol dehydrogenase family)
MAVWRRSDSVREGAAPWDLLSQDIAEMVGFLISDRAGWITRSNFIVDGGQNPSV